MKKLILTAFLATVALGAAAQAKTVPYSTDLATSTAIDPEWTLINAGQGNDWLLDNSQNTWPNPTTGTNAGVYYKYHSSNPADTWLISPAITLEEGKEYTVICWAKTGYGNEKWQVTMATGSSVEEQKAGKSVIDKTAGYKNNTDFERIASVFTAETSGDYHFGLNCCSDKDMYYLYLTGFSVVEGDVAVLPETVYELPYNANFAETTEFPKWESVSGQNAPSAQSWSQYSGFEYVEYSNYLDEQEDVWLISPALNFSEAGRYAIKLNVKTQGVFDICLGTNKEDLSTFEAIESFDTRNAQKEETVNVSALVESAGKYYVAFHAKNEKSNSNGYQIYSIQIKADVPTPVLVDDLTAIANNETLTVDLKWTNPSLNTYGEALDAITKVELYRNDEIITTLTPEVGSVSTYQDQLTAAGVCKYKVLVYGTYGLNENAPMVVDLGYVGVPVATLPWNFNSGSSAKAEDMALWTVIDANEDGNTWAYDPTSYTLEWKSSRAVGVEADDYLSTPYFDLEAGYYYITYNMTADDNTFEFGYATDRKDPVNTFVKCQELTDPSYNQSLLVNIPQSGRYCFVWHHKGTTTSSYYNYVKLSRATIEYKPLVPEVATDLKAVPAADNALEATLSWTNPVLDNAGEALNSLSYAVVYRDDVEIARVTEDLTPGAVMQYIDNTIPTLGEYTWKVEVYNENGCSETAAPTVTLYVGPGRDVPYEVIDFSEWSMYNANGNSNAWHLTYKKYLEFYTYNSSVNDYALSPYIELEAGCTYKATIKTKLYGEYTSATPWSFVVGTDPRDSSSLKIISSFTTTVYETEQVDAVTFVAQNESSASDMTIIAPAGRVVMGFYATDDAKKGDLYVTSFSIEKEDISGVESAVADGEGISFVNGMICFNGEVSNVAIVDLAGRVIYSAETGESINAAEFGSGVVIVTATVNGKPCALKVAL